MTLVLFACSSRPDADNRAPDYSNIMAFDTAFNQLRASAGRGFDVVQPTVDRVPGYVEYDLLQPIDERRVNADKVIPSVMQGRASEVPRRYSPS